jgi:hypothetical protein
MPSPSNGDRPQAIVRIVKRTGTAAHLRPARWASRAVLGLYSDLLNQGNVFANRLNR